MSYGDCLTNQTGLTEFQGRDSVDLLARMIYSEARGESNEGQRGVAFVAQNRWYDGSWGNTYESVLLWPNQFAGMNTYAARCPDLNSPEWAACLSIAGNMGSQTNPIGNRLYFLPYTPPSNAKNVLQIGNHYFFNY